MKARCKDMIHFVVPVTENGSPAGAKASDKGSEKKTEKKTVKK